MSTGSRHPDGAIALTENRFSRFEAITWWDQSLLRRAKVLVVGAGALGNEVIKNCALLGIGNLIIVDNDRIEQSNLSRSVLFRSGDEHLFKAECAERSAAALYPEINALSLCVNVMSDVGLGFFRWADIVIGAVDNREARVFINRACARLGIPWIDGGIDVLNGIVRGFAPPRTACYECTMGKADWDQLNKRSSCSLLARQASVHGGVPTTPTTASVIGALQAQEVVKYLHNINGLFGRGFFFEGLTHTSYTVDYAKKPDCMNHEPPDEVLQCPDLHSGSALKQVWEKAMGAMGGCDSLDFERELVSSVTCPQCGSQKNVYRTAESVTREQLVCRSCSVECTPVFFHSVQEGSGMLVRSVKDTGLPAWDIIWARHRDRRIGIEMSGDDPFLNRNG